MTILTDEVPTLETMATARQAAIVLTGQLVMRPNGYTDHDVVCAAYEVQEALFNISEHEANDFAIICGLDAPLNNDPLEARAILNGVLALISNQ